LETTVPVRHRQLDQLLGEIAAAKLAAADLYDACLTLPMAGGSRARLSPLADDERVQAMLITATRTDQEQPMPLSTVSRPATSRFDSALMLAFALDQAATAALVGLRNAPDPRVTTLAEHILTAEQGHQEIVLAELVAVAGPHPEVGRRLAREMIEARDWIKVAFPRRNRIAALAAAGALPAGAAQAHDAFLGSLGDRIQEALGVLGDL